MGDGLPPGHDEVKAKFLALLNRTETRRAISAWAMQYVLEGSLYSTDHRINTALERLGGADLLDPDGGYLYGAEDFSAWLSDFRSSE